MITNDFKELKLSALGFGTMRLPLKEDRSIDEEKVQEMVDYAMANGINYFDTAYPYHEGKAEIVLGNCLKKYPRDSYYLADKFPGHRDMSSYDPALVFEDQLKKCGVAYFDFYLLHNVCEKSIPVYENEEWKIISYFLKQKEEGKIRHLGFSSHALPETLDQFLNDHPDIFEFVQIQLNYLDWSLQNAKAKYEIIDNHDLACWVMEPLRGGKLAHAGEKWENMMKMCRPEDSIASWGFRWLMALPNCKMILSGMNSLEQMEDNIATFSNFRLLSPDEKHILFYAAEDMKDSVPCTACRYCCEGCPMNLEIPTLISLYNEYKLEKSMNVKNYLETIDENRLPSACIHCNQCADICPQKINVPDVLEKFRQLLD